jgi:hypothetical protein
MQVKTSLEPVLGVLYVSAKAKDSLLVRSVRLWRLTAEKIVLPSTCQHTYKLFVQPHNN